MLCCCRKCLKKIKKIAIFTYFHLITTIADHSENWAKLKAGDQEALLLLYDSFYVGLINYGIKISGDRELTKDCITQILLRLWEKRDALPVVIHVRAYLFTCLRNELITEKKRQQARTVKQSMYAIDAESSELPYEERLIKIQHEKAVQDKIKMAFDFLTERQKELLQLKYYEGYDYNEIASLCNITKRTAYNIVQTALNTLKEHFSHDETKPGHGLARIIRYLPLLF